MSFLNSHTRAAREGIGKPVPRKEDARLVAGSGRFSDDVSLPGQAYACMVRSPHAHARIRRIDSAGAMKVPDVIAVLTGEDAAADGLRPIPHRPVPANPHEVPLKSRDGSEFFIAPHAPLPTDRARFVGEAVAVVIAETPAAAKDGAERVIVDYEPLPAATATADAVAAGAPLVWKEATSNVCVDSEAGDAAADAAFRRAAQVVRLETRINRVTGVPMERARRSACTTRRAAATRSMRARAARCASKAIWPARSPFRRARCAWWRARSAATTEPVTPSIPSSRWSPGRRSVSAVLSNGPVTGERPSSPITTLAISCRTWSSHSTRTATS